MTSREGHEANTDAFGQLPGGFGLSSDSDHLIAALRAHDPAAMELLYEVSGRRAFGLAYRILGDYGTAEDVVQESFVTLWQQAERLNAARGRLIPLLLTIVHNKAIDRRRQKRGLLPLNEVTDVLLLAQPGSDTAELAARELDRSAVLTALASLPAAQVQTIQLAYFEGLTHVEIAATMRVPLGTVKSRLRIALERLRGLLQEHHAS